MAIPTKTHTDSAKFVTHHDLITTVQSYDCYVLIGQNDPADTPIIHTNADAVMLARSIVVLNSLYTKALKDLNKEQREYVVAVLEDDAAHAGNTPGKI